MNITKEGYDMINMMDNLTSIERDMVMEYNRLKQMPNLSEKSLERFRKLGVMLGYITPEKNENIECEGCGS